MGAERADGGEPRWKQRITQTEINGRRVNEAMEQGEEGVGTAVFVCECGHLGCNSTVELGVAEYEDVRKDFNRFLVIPGHEILEVDEVIEQHPQHLVVAKRDAGAQAVVRETDQRAP